MQSLQKINKPIAVWLLIGVAMIIIQILLGGITRLTESGLSITEWKPLTGILPPLNNTQWQLEFDKYKGTDQFRLIHSDFALSDFKFIFFWEWLHRLWARLLGVVFLIGFIYFIVTKKFKKEMISPMIILFLLGAMQGIVGWIMVKSGLVPEKLFVGHIELTTHFIAALILLGYTFWFALSLLVEKEKLLANKKLRNLSIAIFSVLIIQLIYGAFMSGLKAATVAPTWPDINGVMIPSSLDNLSPWFKNLTDNKITVQLIHRTMAYLLTIMVFIWWLRARNIKANPFFNKTKWLPLVCIVLQIILGVLTLITSPYGNNLIWFGILHQLNGIIFLMIIIWFLFLLRRPKIEI